MKNQLVDEPFTCEAGGSNATTGGLKGSYIKFTAVAANLYFVEGLLNSTGSIATPFDTQ